MINQEVQDLVKSQSEKAIKFVDEVKITSQKTMEDAGELLIRVKKAEKLVIGKKEEMTKPINAGLKVIRAFFKPYETQLSDAKDNLVEKLRIYRVALAKKEEIKIQKIEKQVEEGTIDFAKAEEKVEKVTVKQKIETKSGELRFRTDRKMEIVDESLIPRKYFVLDAVKVRREALMGVIIPGVKVVEIKTPITRY